MLRPTPPSVAVRQPPAGGPVAALTVHRTVIHSCDCASLTPIPCGTGAPFVCPLFSIFIQNNGIFHNYAPVFFDKLTFFGNTLAFFDGYIIM